MNVAAAVAQLLKREGVKFLIAYPTNQLIESAAEAGIRTIIVRQERVGVHMADAVGYLTRVANNAGLRGIAGKLTNVRTSLLKVVADGADEDDPAESAARSSGRSRRARKTSDTFVRSRPSSGTTSTRTNDRAVAT